MKIAYIATLPPQAVLEHARIRSRYRQRYQHPVPWVRTIAEAIAANSNIDVCVFCHSRAVRSMERVSRHNVEYCFVPKYEPGHFDSVHGYITARIQIGNEIHRWGADIVQAFGTEGYCGLTASMLRMPSVIQMQGIIDLLHPYMPLSFIDKFARKYFERKAVQRGTVVLAETEFVRQWVLKVSPAKQVYVIPHGVQFRYASVRPTFDVETFLCISSLWEYKGIDTVIRAMSCLLREGNKRTKLIIVGGGPLEADLRRLTRDLAVDRHVQFAGRCNVEMMCSYMRESLALLIGSRMDSSPNVITEAHAAGLPVIGTRAGGIPEMIENGKDGYLVDVDDAAGMAECMRALIRQPTRAAEMGRAGRRKVLVLNDPARVAAAHLRVYNSLAGNQVS